MISKNDIQNNEKALYELLVSVFPSETIPEDFIDLAEGDLGSWDSVGNFNLLLAFEEKFEYDLILRRSQKFVRFESFWNM